ncbi:hypothetical protein INS49_005717 [Diaporthe citri]|uniref:uncharacterized protein n=1 Tax=Diaporthe citri TaxID=83186 RepID=UPI001C81E888|nr:uncharacterized protein INS49_005717 [Diaporthe citri]KAG6364119.1 hypothetical protein INS49_005717 [Diaporthe citri]
MPMSFGRSTASAYISFGIHTSLVDASKHGHTTTVEWLLTAWNGWDADTTRKALLEAVNQWQAQVVDVLLRHVEYEEVVRYQMLEKACGLQALLADGGMPGNEPEDQERQRSLVSRLINTGLDLNHRDQVSGLPVLHIAASNVVLGGALSGLLASGELRTPSLFRGGYGQANNHKREAQYESLVQSNNHGESLLHYAAAGANFEVLQYLLELDVNASTLSEGAEGIDAETLRQIREQGGLEVNAANSNGWTPFLCALTQTVQAPTERRLGSRSIVHEKSGAGALRAAQHLLSAGADPSLVSEEGWAPLHSLAGHDFPDTLDAEAAAALAEDLIARGADVNARAPAFSYGWEGGARYERVPWQWRLPWGFRGAKLMATYPGAARRGITPLHWAADNGCVCVARVLLAHGADPLAEDENGATPETTARYSMRTGASLMEEMAQLLKRG